jgi:hypothetical protein
MWEMEVMFVSFVYSVYESERLSCRPLRDSNDSKNLLERGSVYSVS